MVQSEYFLEDQIRNMVFTEIIQKSGLNKSMDFLSDFAVQFLNSFIRKAIEHIELIKIGLVRIQYRISNIFFFDNERIFINTIFTSWRFDPIQMLKFRIPN